MPELPEVQTLVNDLNEAGLVGTTITGAGVFWPKTIARMNPWEFQVQISGRQIKKIRRRAKYIIFDLSGSRHLLVHLRMTGRLHLSTAESERLKHEHIILHLDDGRQLRYHDTRKFGRFNLVTDVGEIIGGLGLEPLDPEFTLSSFNAAIVRRNRQIKPLLLDQTVIAGLGNIYVDEALWQAKIHPLRLSSSLQSKEVRALHRSIPMVLQKGIDNQGTSLGNGKSNFYSVARRQGRNKDELNVFHRTGQPCLRCGTAIERLIVGQRSTHICPKCQRLKTAG